MSNTNDAIMPALLVWGFWLASSPAARGASTALASWTKFAALIVVPLWLTYPRGLRRRGALARFAAGFGVATAARVLDPAARAVARPTRVRDVLGPDGRRSSSTATRPSPSGAGASTTRAGSPTSPRCRRSSRWASIALAGGRRGSCPRREGPARARRADRRAAARVRALADALVLPLPSVGAARSCCSRCCSRARAPTEPRRGGADARERPRQLAPRRRACVAAAASSSHAALLAAAVVALAGDSHGSDGRRHRHPALPDVRRADRGRARPLPRLRVRVPAGRAPVSRPARARDRLDRPPSASCSPPRWRVAGALGVLLVAARPPPRSARAPPTGGVALAVVALVPLLLGGVILTRFDLVPAALVAGALLLLLSGRLRRGGARRRRRDRGEALPGGARAAARDRRLAPRRPAGARRGVGRARGRCPRSSCTYRSCSSRRAGCSTRSDASWAGRSRSRASERASCSRSTMPPGSRSGGRPGAGSQNLTGTAAGALAVLQAIAQVARGRARLGLVLRAGRRPPSGSSGTRRRRSSRSSR